MVSQGVKEPTPPAFSTNLKGYVSKQFLGIKIGRTVNLNQATHPDGFSH